MSSIFLPSHPPPPTMRNGGRGSICRAKVKFLPFFAPFGGVGSICPDIPLGRELSLHGQDRFAPGRHGEQFCFRPWRTHHLNGERQTVHFLSAWNRDHGQSGKAPGRVERRVTCGSDVRRRLPRAESDGEAEQSAVRPASMAPVPDPDGDSADRPLARPAPLTPRPRPAEST